MTSVGIMASGVVTSACTDVLTEPFNNRDAWTLTGTASNWTFPAGRTGTCIQQASSADFLRYTIPAPSESDTVTIGFAYQISTLAFDRPFAMLQSDSGVSSHLTLQVLTTGALTIRRGSTAGTVLGTSAAGVIAAATWYYIEVQAKLSDTVGAVEVRVNGVAVIGPLTALDTKNAGTKTVFDTLALTFSTGGGSNRWDDLYLSTGSGCAFKGDPNPNNVLGEPFNNFTDAPWTVTGSPSIVAGRTGTAASMTGSTARLDYTIAAGNVSNYFTIGFAFQCSVVSTAHTVAAFYVGGVLQAALQIETGGLKYVTTNGATTVSATGLIANNTWCYVELQVFCHATAGSVTIRLNGATIASATNIDTFNSATPDQMRLFSVGGTTHLYDDLYLSTGAGATFKGSITIP